MKLLYTIVMTFFVLFIITFSLANTSAVPIRYYGFIDVPVAAYLLIFVSFGVGIIFAGFMGIVERLRLVRQVKKLKKQVKALEKKIPSEEIMPTVQEDITTPEENKWNL